MEVPWYTCIGLNVPLILDQRIAGSIPINSWHFCPLSRHSIKICCSPPRCINGYLIGCGYCSDLHSLNLLKNCRSFSPCLMHAFFHDSMIWFLFCDHLSKSGTAIPLFEALSFILQLLFLAISSPNPNNLEVVYPTNGLVIPLGFSTPC